MAHSVLVLCSALIFIASATLSAAQGGGSAGVSVELWCVAKNNAGDSALQTALDWACGPGGANCVPIQRGGPCYDASDIQKTASFAFNDYCLHNGMTEDSCNFDNTAALTSLNPSYGGCQFPSSKSAGNGNFTGSVTGGLEPSVEDANSGYVISNRWMWSLVIIHLLYTITRFL